MICTLRCAWKVFILASFAWVLGKLCFACGHFSFVAVVVGWPFGSRRGGWIGEESLGIKIECYFDPFLPPLTSSNLPASKSLLQKLSYSIISRLHWTFVCHASTTSLPPLVMTLRIIPRISQCGQSKSLLILQCGSLVMISSLSSNCFSVLTWLYIHTLGSTSRKLNFTYFDSHRNP